MHDTLQLGIHVLQGEEHGLHGRVVGDVAAALLVAHHAKFDVVDVLVDSARERVDFFIANELLRRVLEGKSGGISKL